MATQVDINELRGMDLAQLEDLTTELEGKLLGLEFDHATKGIDNPIDIRTVRRDIARVKTVHRGKELESVDPTTRAKIRNRRRNQ